MNLLLKKNNLFKLNLLSQFSSCSTVLTQQMLAETLNIGHHKLKKQISILNEDLYELFGDDVQIVKVIDGYRLKLPQELDSIHLLETLKLHYLKQATTFDILQSLLRKNYYSIEELAGDLHLTSSYVYKQLTQLNKVLEPLGIHLTFTQDFEESNFVGEETVLRYFIFSFYWSSYKTQKLPSQRTSLNETKITLDKLSPYLTSPSKQQYARYYIAYSMYRSVEKKCGVKLDEQFTKLVTLLQQTNDLSIYSVENYPSDLTTILENENLFFNFVIRNFLSIDTPEEQLYLAQQFIKTELPLSKLAQQFIDAILNHWQLHLSDIDYYILIYRIVITMLFIRYIGISFYEAFHYSENFTFEAFPTSVPKELYKKIAEFHAMFNKNNPLAHELLFEKKYFHIAYTWIYYIIDYAKNTQLKIAIHFSKDTLSELFIQNKIRQIYSEHSVTFVQQMSEADIIISDFAEPAVDNKTIVYMGNIFEENNWFSLFQCIQEKLFSKTLL